MVFLSRGDMKLICIVLSFLSMWLSLGNLISLADYRICVLCMLSERSRDTFVLYNDGSCTYPLPEFHGNDNLRQANFSSAAARFYFASSNVCLRLAFF